MLLLFLFANNSFGYNYKEFAFFGCCYSDWHSFGGKENFHFKNLEKIENKYHENFTSDGIGILSFSLSLYGTWFSKEIEHRLMSVLAFKSSRKNEGKTGIENRLNRSINQNESRGRKRSLKSMHKSMGYLRC